MVKDCDVCGHRGFSNALLYCSKCDDTTVHQYCLGIPPGSIDDTFNWVCEYCSPPTEPGSSACQKFIRTFIQETLESFSEHAGAQEMENEQCRNEIIPFLDQPKPLCTLLPIQYHGSLGRTKSSIQSQAVEEIQTDAYITLGHSWNYRQEQEAPFPSFMDYPESIMSGIVLLVSPSGEIIIQEGRSFCDISRYPGLEIPMLNFRSNSTYINSDKASKKMGLHKVIPDSYPLGKRNENYGVCDSGKMVELDAPSLGTQCHLNEPESTKHIDTAVNAGDKNEEDKVLQLNALSKVDVEQKKGRHGRYRKSLDFRQKDKGVSCKVSVCEAGEAEAEGQSKKAGNLENKRKRERLENRQKDRDVSCKVSVCKAGEAEAEGQRKKAGNLEKKRKRERLKNRQKDKGVSCKVSVCEAGEAEAEGRSKKAGNLEKKRKQERLENCQKDKGVSCKVSVCKAGEAEAEGRSKKAGNLEKKRKRERLENCQKDKGVSCKVSVCKAGEAEAEGRSKKAGNLEKKRKRERLKKRRETVHQRRVVRRSGW